MKVYSVNYKIVSFSIINIFVGYIIFLYFIGALQNYASKSIGTLTTIQDCIVIGSLVPLLAVAVESRFSILAFALMSLRAFDVASRPASQREKVLIYGGATLFALAFMLIGTLMFQTTNLPMELL